MGGRGSFSLFIHSIDKCLLSTYYVLGTFLISVDTEVNRTDKTPCPQGASILAETKCVADYLLSCPGFWGGTALVSFA